MTPITSSFIGAAASSNPSYFFRAGSNVFFAANDGVHGVEPWISDGTAAGTAMIANIGASPTFIGTLGLAAIFTTYDSAAAGEVFWKTDGTGAGTVKLFTIPHSNNSGWYAEPIFADSRFYVLMQPAYSSPVELYVSDGTAAGSKDLGAFPAHLSPTPVGANGFLYFLGQDTSVGPQLWVSNGTVIGTHMVRRGIECPSSSCGPAPTGFLRAGSQAMFLTADSLWTVGNRGTTIQQIASIAAPSVFAPSSTASRAYLIAKDGTLWSTDGTAAGTAAITAGTAFYPSQTLDDGRLLFSRPTADTKEMWMTDGTTAGTVKVGVLPPLPSAGIVAVAGNKVFLAAGNSTTGTELWLADLDNLTISLVDDIDSRIGINGPSSSSPGVGAVLGSKVLFPATDFHGRELWQSDGTTAGTSLLANIAPDPGGGVISGTVRIAADGSALPNATVLLCPPSGGSCDGFYADAVGHYHIDGVIPGTYQVAASGYLYNAQAQNVSVTAGMETSGVDFSLVRGGRISGTVTRASTGQPIGTNNGVLSVSIFTSTGVRVDAEGVRADGTYISSGLPAGTYYALVSGNYFSNGVPAVNQTYKNHDCAFPTCTWQNGDAISVTNGVTTQGVDFSLHAYGTIAGKLRDDAGNPLTNFPVAFLPPGSTNATISVQTDKDGAYVSPPLNPGSYYVLAGGFGFDTKVYPNGACSSFFSCTPAGGSPVNVAVDGATTGIDFQLAPAKGRIVGTIRDSNGALFSGVDVDMRDTKGYYISAYGGPTHTDASGHYEFDGIPDGTYYINAADELYPGVDCPANPCSTAAATPIVLTAGHSVRADMQLLSQRTTISGHLVDSVTKQRLTTGYILLFEGSGVGLGNDFVNNGTYTVTTIGRSKTYLVYGSAGGYHGAMYPNVRWDCASSCYVPPGGTPIPAGTSANIDISIDPRGSIGGTVTDAATGKPVPNVEVLFYWADGHGYATSVMTNDKGFYSALADPGSYVSYTTGGYYYSPQVYDGRPCSGNPCDASHGRVVTVTDGVATTGIDFHLTSLNQYGAIRGHVFDAETGLPMQNVYVDCGSFSARTDAQGAYFIGAASNVLPGLATGQYTMYTETDQPYFIGLSGGGACADLFVCRNNGTAVQVTAPGTTTVDFRMIKLRLTSVAPAYGLTTGGTRITLNGANFTPSASVLVGDTAATIVSATPTQIVALTPPAAAGAAHVTVRLAPNLSVTFAQAFTYVTSMTAPDTPAIPGTPIKPGHGLP